MKNIFIKIKAPLFGAIVLTICSISGFAQNKIVLKDKSLIKDAEYHTVRNGVIEYLQNGSLHDVDASTVLWAEKADGSRLYFDEKGNAYVKQNVDTVVNKPATKPTVVVKDENQAYFDSMVVVKQKRDLRKAAYEKQLALNNADSSKYVQESSNSYRPERRYRAGTSSYQIGYIEGKRYRAHTLGRDVPNPMDVNKLPIPAKYANNEDYKSGFLYGIKAKEHQRIAAIVLPLAGALLVSIIFVGSVISSGASFIYL